jgi:TonB family protein
MIAKYLKKARVNWLLQSKGECFMLKTIFLAVVFFILSFNSVAQTQNDAEANWEKYNFREHNFSVLLPKLPVVIKTQNIGISEQREEFGAYSNGVVYMVASVFELKDNEQKNVQVVKEAFSENNYALRLSEIRHRYRALDLIEMSVNRNNLKGARFSNGEWTFELYFIPQQKRWYELWAVNREKSNPEINRFFESFKIESNATGKIVGTGAPAIIGDVTRLKYNLPNQEPKEIGLKDPNVPNRRQNVFESARIVLMPRPSYTEEARKAGEHGIVRLRVTFASNGTVTDIQPDNNLPNGLTDSAINAAKKILFVPAAVNKEFVSTSKIIEYNFTAY